MKRSLAMRIRQDFLKGLAILFPTLITYFVLTKGWELIDQAIGQPITAAMVYVLVNYLGVNEADIGNTFFLTVIGFSLATLFVFLVGLMVATFVGRRVFRYFERLFATIPVIKIIYPYAKQVTEFFSSENERPDFAGVVAIEYPRKGIYSLGFITGKSLKSLVANTGNDMVNLFMPSSPTPITGYVIHAPVSELHEIDMSVEEAVRFIVSGGVLIPPQQIVHDSLPPKEGSLAELNPSTLKILKPKDETEPDDDSDPIS